MPESPWTNDVLKTFFEVVIHERELRYQQQFAALAAQREQQHLDDLRFEAERDRRYTEVSAARAEALKIKEQGDRDALQLAREIQTYKDEKANELREQINSERFLYATKNDLKALTEKFEVTMAPVLTYVASQQGRSRGMSQGAAILTGVVGLIVSLLVIGGVVVAITQAVQG